jgi:hypothetical protein
MRPLGSGVFGWLGDTIGRSRTMLISVSLMALPTFLLGSGIAAALTTLLPEQMRAARDTRWAGGPFQDDREEGRLFACFGHPRVPDSELPADGH